MSLHGAAKVTPAPSTKTIITTHFSRYKIILSNTTACIVLLQTTLVVQVEQWVLLMCVSVSGCVSG